MLKHTLKKLKMIPVNKDDDGSPQTPAFLLR